MKFKFCLLLALLIASKIIYSQAASFTDIEEGFRKIILEKSGKLSEGYQRIGTLRVTGTSFLFGGEKIADVYLKNESATNVPVIYDTYRKMLAVKTGESNKYIFKKLEEIDSLTIKPDFKDIQSELPFINAIYLDSSKKFLMQRVVAGPRFNLYKTYNTDLGYIPGSYAQTDARQFELTSEYFYTETGKPGLKKLKTSANSLRKEFKHVKDLSDLVNDEPADSNRELLLIKVFTVINR